MFSIVKVSHTIQRQGHLETLPAQKPMLLESLHIVKYVNYIYSVYVHAYVRYLLLFIVKIASFKCPYYVRHTYFYYIKVDLVVGGHPQGSA